MTARNRVVIPPMQQSAGMEGMARDWHLAHPARFSMGGAGIVFVESTTVEVHGRNTHGDIGIWSDAHAAPLPPTPSGPQRWPRPQGTQRHDKHKNRTTHGNRRQHPRPPG